MMRYYVNTNEDVAAAITLIYHLVQTSTGVFGIDIETAPMEGLVGYPGTVIDDDGKHIKASKKAYVEYAHSKWLSMYNQEALALKGLFLPKVTSKEKSSWVTFLQKVRTTSEEEIRDCRWTAESKVAVIQQLENEIADFDTYIQLLQSEIEALTASGKKGVKVRQTKCAKAVKAREDVCSLLQLLHTYTTQGEAFDYTLLKHITECAVEGYSLDPVRPGLDPHTSTIFLVQFTMACGGELHSWIFNTHKVDCTLLAPLFTLKGVYVGANIKFDLAFLMHNVGCAPKNVFCTFLASRLLNLGKDMSHSLANVYKRYTGKDISKEIRSSFIGKRLEEPTPAQLEYAYLDTEILLELYDVLIAEARQTNQVKLISQFSQLSWLVAKWELEGILLDRDLWLSIAEGTIETRDQYAKQLEEMLLPPSYKVVYDNTLTDEEDPEEEQTTLFKITQTELVKDMLTTLLGFNPATVFKTGKVSLDKDGRSALEREYRKRKGDTHPFFLLYSRWSKRAKQVSTYGPRFLKNIHPLTGRVHAQFGIAGTDTARFTCTSPNMLNIPAAKEEGDPDFRSAFRAKPGHYWLGADYDTMEFRIAGNISRDPVVRTMMNAGVDAHAFTAAQMFHIVRDGDVDCVVKYDGVYQRGADSIPITMFKVPAAWTNEEIATFAKSDEAVEAVMKAPKKITRTDAKSVTFLYLFRGTSFTLATRTGLRQDVCDAFFARFTDVYRDMDTYMNTLASTAIQTTVVGADGVTYAYSEGYGNIRRYVRLPEDAYFHEFASRRDYDDYVYYVRSQERAAERKLVNLPCQGGNAVITTDALLLILKQGEPFNVFPVLSIYDEIICEFPEDLNPRVVAGILEGSMLHAANTDYMTFIPASASADISKVGAYWVKS